MTVNFGYDKVTEAIIYCHWGTSEAELKDFFKEVEKQTSDTRFDDPSYLAAKFVVWKSQQLNNGNPLDFVSLGVCQESPGDVIKTYHVDCGNGRNHPIIT